MYPPFFFTQSNRTSGTTQSARQYVRRQHNGFSLPELCVVAALIGIAAAMAAPAIGQWQWRARVENTAQAWAADLQSARLHALRTGQAMQLQRLNNCTQNKLPNGDWRCGWELVNPADNSQTAVLSSALNGDLSVVLAPAQNQLPINAQGEPVAGGLRLVIQPAQPGSKQVRSICINTAGRLRMVNASSCS
jgi:prepilin-type N-terminal cleavage/methylation domain-containing protein